METSLVKENKWLIESLACRYGFKGIDLEATKQAGAIGVVRAARKFNKNRGVKFSTYAYKYVRGEVLREIESQRKQPEFSLDTGYYISLTKEKFDSSIIMKEFEKLSEREQLILSFKFGLYDFPVKSFTFIGPWLGISRQAAHITYQKAIKKLKIRLRRGGY